jgi:streptogramin lyase
MASFTLPAIPPQTKVIAGSNSSVGTHFAGGSNGSPQVRPALTLPGASSGLALDNPGDIWIAGPTSVLEDDNNGNLLATYTGGGLGGSNNNTAGIAIDGDGQVWVPNSNGSLTELNSSGTALSPTTGFAAGLNAPSGVAVDNAGTVWIANSGNNTVTRVFGAASPTTTPLSNANYSGSFGVRP